MAAVQQTVVLFVLERRWKIEQIEGPGKRLYSVVHISRGLRVFTDYQVVKLTGAVLLKDCTDQECGGAAVEVLTNYPLRTGH